MPTKKRKKANQKIRTLAAKSVSAKEAGHVKGGKQKPDGNNAGNVAAKWSLAQGAAA